MVGFACRFVLLAICVALMAGGAFAEKRVALVVAIEKYDHLQPLANPIRDGRATAGLLRENGFDVETLFDVDHKGFVAGLSAFANMAADADVAVVLFSGHGMTIVRDRQFVNALASRNATIDCKTRTAERMVTMRRVMETIASVPKQILLFDSCRNQAIQDCDETPLTEAMSGFQSISTRSTRQEAGRARSVGRRGFRPVDGDARPTENPAILIGYSTGLGQTASDGPAGGNSPFITALLQELKSSPRAPIRTILEQTSRRVASSAGQRPWVVTDGGEPEVCLAGKDCETNVALREAKLVEQSRLLAEVAQGEAANGQGRKAVSTALKALPRNMTAPERPMVPEAVAALYSGARAPLRTHHFGGAFGPEMVGFSFSYDDASAILYGQKRVGYLLDLRTGRKRPFDQFPGIGRGHLTRQIRGVLGAPDDQRFLLMHSARHSGPDFYIGDIYRGHVNVPALKGAQILDEGDSAAALILGGRTLAILDKRTMGFIEHVKREPRLTLASYFDGFAETYPDIRIGSVLAIHADTRRAVLRNPATGKLELVSLKDKKNRVLKSLRRDQEAFGAISSDGSSYVVFFGAPSGSGNGVSQDKDAGGKAPSRQSAFVGSTSSVDDTKERVQLDLASDWRCARINDQPRFRDADKSVIAIDRFRSGLCVWNSKTGQLTDRMPTPVENPSHELRLSPKGRWILEHRGAAPISVRSTERLFTLQDAADVNAGYVRNPVCRQNEADDWFLSDGVLSEKPKVLKPINDIRQKFGLEWYNWPGVHWIADFKSEDLMPGWCAGPLSPSGRYWVVTTYNEHLKRNDQAAAKETWVALLDLKTRNVICRVRIDRADATRTLDDIGVRVFDVGPTLMIQRMAIVGPPVFSVVRCPRENQPQTADWKFQHDDDGDPGITSVVLGARISTDGERLLTLANDWTLRLWDIYSGVELWRTEVKAYADGSLRGDAAGRIVLTEKAYSSGGKEVSRDFVYALPSEPVVFVEQMRQGFAR